LFDGGERRMEGRGADERVYRGTSLSRGSVLSIVDEPFSARSGTMHGDQV
jgi:hypothetical protein